MNIMQKLTWKCMRQNKKRTIVTIVGVTICVAMISAVCIIATSFQDARIRESIAKNGSYEGKFNIRDEKVLQGLLQEEAFDKTLRIRTIGSASLSENSIKINNTYRNTLAIAGIDGENSELNGILFKKGHMAEKDNEIVLSEELMNDKGFTYNINDTISLVVKSSPVTDENGKITEESREETRTFKITGIVEVNTGMRQDSVFHAFTTYQNNKDSDWQLLVTFHSKSNMIDDMESIARKYKIDKENYTLHSALTYLYGANDDGLMQSTMTSCFILFIIIIIGGVSLIYNAFSISLSERSRYLGMLSSIGATRKQRRNSVFFESILIGLIAIPLGIVSSMIGLNLTFMLMNPYVSELFGNSQVGFRVVIETWTILVTILFAIIILFFSAWIPSRRAARISPILAIRQNKDIKIKRKYFRHTKLIRKVFGIEGELGLKNMKRNKSRYLATLSSLIICVVLFMSANYFSSMMKQSFFVLGSKMNYDVKVQIHQDYKVDQYTAPNQNLVKELQHLPHVDHAITYQYTSLNLVDRGILTDSANAFMEDAFEVADGFSLPDVVFLIHILDDVDYASYVKDLKISKDPVASKEPSAIIVNKSTAKYPLQKKYKDIEWLDIAENDVINVETRMASGDEVVPIKIRIASLTDKGSPIVISEDAHYSASIVMVMNTENFSKLNNRVKEMMQPEVIPVFSAEFLTKDDLALEQEIAGIAEKYNIEDTNYYINNLSQAKRIGAQETLLTNVFLYGFATLIAIICIANIINTVSTGINLRKREFAMIRSVGITPRKIKKMMAFEILFYGIKACIYGGILGVGAMYLIYEAINISFDQAFEIPVVSTLIMMISIFLILAIITLYAIRKLQKDNIVETIRQESI